MFSDVQETSQAIFSSRRFTRFFNGIVVESPSHPPTQIKILSVTPSLRIPGYRFVKHSMVTRVSTDKGVRGWGYGESDVELLAIQKSIAEAIERAVFKSAQQENPALLSSSGWAAHLSKEKAQTSARMELLERDAALTHWFTQTPLREIEIGEWPKTLQNWALKELSQAPRFNRLRILLTHLGFIPALTVILHDHEGFGFVAHATAQNFRKTLEKAMQEVCRIADFAHKGYFRTDDPTTAEGHTIYYSIYEKLPLWIFGEKISWKRATAQWRTEKLKKDLPLEFTYTDYDCGGLWVSHCQNPQVQNLFFGNTQDALAKGRINLARFGENFSIEALCPKPHFVP